MTTNLKKLRRDFPVFSVKPEWAYLDSSATTQMPQAVIDAMGEYQCAYRASVHRGLYPEAVRATERYEEARRQVGAFIGTKRASEVIFTSGATASSNMLVAMLEHSLTFEPGDEIVTSVMEHHSALVPLQELARRKGLTIRYVPLTRGYALDLDSYTQLLTPRTRIVSIMYASNVLGTINSLATIAARAHAVGAIVVSDMTAAVGHVPVSVRRLGVDAAYFSGHKMCGPNGIGVLWARRDLLATLSPGFYGGGMIDTVTLEGATYATGTDRFEAGTPNVAGAIGLGAAAEYLAAHDLTAVHRYVAALTAMTQQALERIPGVRVYSAPATKNVGVVSFTVAGVHPHDLAEIAARHGVAIRAGHHCAMPLHGALGVPATARASVYLYTTKQDIDLLVESIHAAQTLFKTR